MNFVKFEVLIQWNQVQVMPVMVTDAGYKQCLESNDKNPIVSSVSNVGENRVVLDLFQKPDFVIYAI